MRIAVIGDVHRRWDDADSASVDALGYDLVCFVGDLPDLFHRGTLAVARSMARLTTRAVLLPGNHDGTSPLGVLLDGLGIGSARPGQARRALGRLDRLQRALGPIPIVGYSVHLFPTHDVTLVAARPFAMGGGRASFPALLQARHGVADLAGSRERLGHLLGLASGRVVVLAHNGPAGLGSGPRAPFADRRGRDLGDADLRDAIADARAAGCEIVAVVAGHLHHRGHDRQWVLDHGGVTYVNAARVPRIEPRGEGTVRHHVALHIEPGGVEVHAEQIRGPGLRR